MLEHKQLVSETLVARIMKYSREGGIIADGGKEKETATVCELSSFSVQVAEEDPSLGLLFFILFFFYRTISIL